MRGVFLCRRRVQVVVNGQKITTSFLNIEGRKLYVGVDEWRKRAVSIKYFSHYFICKALFFVAQRRNCTDSIECSVIL